MSTARLRGPATSLLLLPLLLLLAACGGSDESSRPSPSASSSAPDGATSACRAKWKDLRSKVDDAGTTSQDAPPSALTERWNAVGASVDHYVAAGTADDCGSTLADQEKAMTKLTAFSKQLSRFDLELRLSRLKEPGSAYASRAKAPTRPAPKGAKKGAKRQTGPAPKQVKAALATLEKQAAKATSAQRPAWQQAVATDPGNAKAVAKAVKDLRFLSGESKAYRAGSAAADQVQRAVSFTG